jgi:hypothetical protein
MMSCGVVYRQQARCTGCGTIDYDRRLDARTIRSMLARAGVILVLLRLLIGRRKRMSGCLI